MSFPTCAVYAKDELRTATWCGKVLGLSTQLATTNAQLVRCRFCKKAMELCIAPDYQPWPKQKG